MYLGRRFTIAVLLGTVPAVLSPVEPWAVLVAVESLVVVVLAVDMLIAPDPWRMRLRRRVPDVLRLGRTAKVVLTLHNPTNRRLEVAIHDAAPPSLARTPRRHRVWLAPGAWADLPAEVQPARRGKAVLGPVTVRTRGPLGLGGRQATYSLLDEVKVYPAFRGRAEVELRLRRGRLLQSGLRSSAIRGGGSDFDSLREYRPDDEFRRINWRATARSTKPIANEFREERNQQVILLVDASRAMAAQVEGVSRLEHALDAAVAVAELASRVGDHVGAVAFGRDVRAEIGPRGTRDQPRRIVDLLFDLEPMLEAPDYARAFGAVLARHRRRALLLLFTDLPEPSVLEPLLRAIPVLLSRHLVLVAAVRDPEVESLATSLPSTSIEAYEKSAAAGFLAWREAAVAHLRRLGATTVDRLPGKLAAQVADEYLRIKALGRL